MNGEEQPSDPGAVSHAACRLARYLRANPLAGDTKEGIAQWWLGFASVSVDVVGRAIALLQEAGVLETVRAADGHVRYRRVSIDAEGDARLDRFIAVHADPTARH
ncbi:hypothetical protein ISN76_10385 [Dyella halodurans]|uniref:MarR family transcriptional regulator n=1 Tax=Dyella halodurans TaxID=1920171 RepID=A0ABV9C287_9GAMM|nr:hypothetical protein [Dyella halodurans]